VTTTRTLFIEVQDDGITSVEEPHLGDVLGWLDENGITHDMLTGWESQRLAEHLAEPARVIPALAEAFAKREGRTLDTNPTGEPFDIEATCTPEEAAARIAKAKVERAKMMGEPVPVYGAAGKVIGTATEEGRREGKMPSERALELAASRLPGKTLDGEPFPKTVGVWEVLAVLDERLGVGP